MERFRYIALAEGGGRVRGVVRSGSRVEALAKLIGSGYHPIEMRRAGGGGWSIGSVWRRVKGRVSVAEVAALTRQLAALLKAQVPVVEALGVLERQCGRARLAGVVSEVRETLKREAGNLADALAEHPRVFDAVYCGMVRSGEEGGNLVEVLEGLAGHLTNSARVRSQVGGAFIYPALLLVAGVGAVAVLMTFVIPQFAALFESLGQELPWPTKVLMQTSGWAHRWWWAGLAVAGLVGMGLWGLARRPGARRRYHGALLRLPVIGRMLLTLEAGRICRTLAALLGGGVRIVEALGITAKTVKNAALGATFTGAAREVTVGSTLGDAFERAGVYPPLMISLIRTGEESGQLPQMLKELAEVYQHESERAIGDAVKLLEPALILVMGVAIAGIVAAVILPIFQSNLAAS